MVNFSIFEKSRDGNKILQVSVFKPLYCARRRQKRVITGDKSRYDQILSSKQKSMYGQFSIKAQTGIFHVYQLLQDYLQAPYS